MDDEFAGRLTGLPPELRVLVDFLHVEPRPTAIFQVSTQQACCSEHDAPPVYLNPAFYALRSVKNELHDLRRAWQQSCVTLRSAPVQLEKRQLLVGARWEIRLSGVYRLVIMLAKELDGTTDQNVNEGEHPLLAAPTRNGCSTTVDYNWTTHAIPNMSPWIAYLRNFDWASTAVGPMEGWPVMLRQYLLSIMLNPNPRLIVWGKDMTVLYNEACVDLMGQQHPECLGQSAELAFAEKWAYCKPLLAKAYNGQTSTIDRLAREIYRDGVLEETYWDMTMLPIFNYDGEGIGMFEELTDTTLLVTGERRRAAIGYLSEQMSLATTLPELWRGVLDGFKFCDVDFPYMMLYEVVEEEHDAAESLAASMDSYNPPNKKGILVGSVGIHDDVCSGLPETFSLTDDIETGPGMVPLYLQAWRNREIVHLAIEDDTLPQELRCSVKGRSFDAPVTRAHITPVISTGGSDVLALLVIGLNPRAAYKKEYELFVNIVHHIIEKAAALISLPQEQRRAQRIADEINNALAQQLRLATIQAERSEAKFYRLASAAPTGMFMFDANGRTVYVNDTYLEMLGETRDAHTIKRSESMWLAEIHEEDQAHFKESWKKITEQKAPVTIEYRSRRPWKSIDKSSGQEISGDRWLLATAFPEIEADGKVATVQGWVTDISHRRFSENLLAQRLEDALENKRQSENFIDMTSHEMRNPLSAILQSADSIIATLDDAAATIPTDEIATMAVPFHTVEEIIDAAQTIILCAQHQKRIVDDILTLSKLDANLLVISPDRVQPPVLVEKVLKMYEAEIARADIDASVCIEQSYHNLDVDFVVLDPSRLLQVVINLITNSIKFTQDSPVRQVKICLGASMDPPTGAHHNVAFVPPRHAPKPMLTPTPEWGSGEDIYLQIAVYDTGRGLSEDEMKSLFQRFQQASPKTYKQYGGSGLGLFISRELCELQGGQIGVASGNGQTVFTFFVKCKRWVSPDDDDGGPLSRQVSRQSLHVLAANAASPIAYSRRASINISSPPMIAPSSPTTRTEALSDRFPQLVRRTTNKDMSSMSKLSEVVEELAVQDDKTELHVLIVEDNLINQKVISQQLRKAGCVVHVANHGLECLDFLERSSFCSATVPLSVVLLDLEMPVMDGLTCIRHIRDRQLDGSIISHVPVIAVTANARSEQITTALDAGMDQVVTKPFRIPELMPQIQALIAEIAARAIDVT